MTASALRHIIALTLITALLVPALNTLPGEAEGATGGDDKRGHRWFDNKEPIPPNASFQWIDINGSRDVGIPTGFLGDDTAVRLELNVTIRFYGIDYDTIWVSSNGYLDFGPSSNDHDDSSNENIPTLTSPNNAVYPFWDDLYPRGNSTVWWDEQGAAPNRVVIVMWENMSHWGHSDADFTFQCIMYENDTQYKFQYLGMIGGNSDGDSATIGIEDPTGTYALKYSYKQPVIVNGTCIIINQTKELHDMAVLGLTARRAAEVGELMEIDAEIANRGRENQTYVNFTFRVNGTPVNWTGPVVNLSAFDVTNLKFHWTPPATANYTLSVKAEPVTGETVLSNNEVAMSVDARHWKGHILVDQTHGCANHAQVIKALENLTYWGVSWTVHTEGEITAEVLEGYDAFVPVRTFSFKYDDNRYTVDEVNVIKNFVTNESKGLLVLGGYTGPFQFWSVAPHNQWSLTRWAGIDWHHGGLEGVTGVVNKYEITHGITSVDLKMPTLKLSCQGMGSRALVNDSSTSPNATGEPMLAVSMSGQGKVAAFADHRAFGNSTWTMADNAQLFGQMIMWLMPDDEPPAVPAGLAVEAPPGGGALELTWDANVEPDAMGYTIMRAVGGIDGTYLELDTTHRTGFTDTGLIDGLEYYYKISAFDEMPNVSPFSDPVGGIPMDVIAPAVPAGLTVLNPGTGDRLELAWDASTDPDVEMYRVYGSDSQGGQYDLLAEVPGGTERYNDTGLTEDQTYWYKVSAVDEVPNPSPMSTAVPGTPHDTFAPATPKGLTIVDPGLGERLELGWSANTEDDLEGYILYRAPVITGPFEMVVELPADATGHLDAGLVDDQKYYYRLSAFDDAEPPNESPASLEVEGKPTDSLAPDPPANLTAELQWVEKGGVFHYSVLLEWDVPQDTTDLSSFRLYRSIRAGLQPSSTYFILGLPPSTCSYVDTFVDEGLDYHYIVTSVDDTPNESPPTEEAQVHILDMNPPPTPAPPTVVAPKEGGELIVTWTAVNDLDTRTYTLYVSGDETGDYSPIAYVGVKEKLEYRHSGLVNGQQYWYRVSASDEVPNESPLSAPVQGVPVDGVAPAAPTGLAVSLSGDGGAIEVSWSPNTEADLAGYKVFRRAGEDGALEEVAELGPKGTSYLDTEVEAGVEYFYSVLAFDGTPNESPRSPELSATPGDLVPPSPPSNVRAESVDGTTMRITWDAPPEEDIDGYIIYVKIGDVWVEVDRADAGTGETSYEVPGPGNYAVRVVAVDLNGNESDPSAEVNVAMEGGSDGVGGDQDDRAAISSGTLLMLIAVVAAVVVAVVLLMVIMRTRGAEEGGDHGKEDEKGPGPAPRAPVPHPGPVVIKGPAPDAGEGRDATLTPGAPGGRVGPAGGTAALPAAGGSPGGGPRGASGVGESGASPDADLNEVNRFLGEGG